MPERPLTIALPRLLRSYPVYEEIFTAITASLEQAGATVRSVASLREVDAKKDDLVLLVGSLLYHEAALETLARLRQDKVPLPIFLWHMEPIPDAQDPLPVVWAQLAKGHWELYRHRGKPLNSRGSHYALLQQAGKRRLVDHLFVYTRRKAMFLEHQGIPAEFLAIGGHPLWGSVPPEDAPRDIDVLFVGGIWNPRRRDLLTVIRAALAAQGVTLKTTADFGLEQAWGEGRNRLIQRAKVYLCVYTHAQDSSGMRLALGIGNGALVVTEPIADPYPFVPGRHFVEAPVSDLAAAVLACLRDDAGRARICRDAAVFMAQRYSMSESAQRIVALARQHAQQRLRVGQ